MIVSVFLHCKQCMVLSFHSKFRFRSSDRPKGYNSVYSSDSAEDSGRERVKKTVLGRLARKRFEAMLRGLSGKRGEIARRMAFSLEHAETANEESDGALSPPSIASPSRVPQ